MNLDWMRDLSHAERQERIEMVQSARPTLELLKGILQKRAENIHKGMMLQQNYESPAWSEMQADYIGALRELSYVISLLTLDRETK